MLALLMIVALGVGLRCALVAVNGQDTAAGSIVFDNASIAHNLLHGNGYMMSVSSETNDVLQATPSIPLQTATPLDEMLRRHPHGALTAVPPTFMPRFPLVASIIWRLAGGRESYTSVQLVQGVLDGALGSLLVYVLLRSAGLPRAGVLGAAAYALQPPLIYESTRFLPDAWSALLPLIAVTGLVIGVQRRHELAGCAFAGLVVGLAGWLRSDYTALVVLLIPVVIFAGRRSSRARCAAMASTLVISWAIPAVALSIFFTHAYGEFHLNRPGIGLLAWEGIGQQPNPWGIGPAPDDKGNIDAAAGRFLEQHGYTYGDWDADAFLTSETIRYARERPAWFAASTMSRVARVATLRVAVLKAPLAHCGFASRCCCR